MAKLTAKLVEEQLRAHKGNISAVARACQVTRQGVQAYMRDKPSLQAVLKETRESMKDGAESRLYEAVDAGESWAICFFLKCQAKDRGYIEKDDTLEQELRRKIHELEDLLRAFERTHVNGRTLSSAPETTPS